MHRNKLITVDLPVEDICLLLTIKIKNNGKETITAGWLADILNLKLLVSGGSEVSFLYFF